VGIQACLRCLYLPDDNCQLGHHAHAPIVGLLWFEGKEQLASVHPRSECRILVFSQGQGGTVAGHIQYEKNTFHPGD
jgi:hypothetical protein